MKKSIIALFLVGILSAGCIAGCSNSNGATASPASKAVASSSKEAAFQIPDNILELMAEKNDLEKLAAKKKNIYIEEHTVDLSERDYDSSFYFDGKVCTIKDEETTRVYVKELKKGYLENSKTEDITMLYFLGDKFDKYWDSLTTALFDKSISCKVTAKEEKDNLLYITTEITDKNELEKFIEMFGVGANDVTKSKEIYTLNKDFEILEHKAYLEMAGKEELVMTTKVEYGAKEQSADPEFAKKTTEGTKYSFIMGPGTDEETKEEVVINNERKFSIYYPDKCQTGAYSDADCTQELKLLDGSVTTIYIKLK